MSQINDNYGDLCTVTVEKFAFALNRNTNGKQTTATPETGRNYRTYVHAFAVNKTCMQALRDKLNLQLLKRTLATRKNARKYEADAWKKSK